MNHWNYVALGDICTVERGGSPRPIDDFITTESDGINWIKIGDTDESMYITKTAQKIKPEGMKKSRYVKPGDFLLSNSMSFGRPYILKIDGCIHDGWLVLRDENNVFDKKFLYYYLSAPITYEKFKSMAVGGVVNNLNSDMVRKIRVPLPSKQEQRDIADSLDKITNLHFLRKQQLAKLDELVKARFVEMFGDAKLNPYDFPCNSLSEYILFLTSGSRGWSRYFTDSGEYFITIKNVKNCRITLQDVQYVTPPDNAEAKRTKVQENDLLISITADLGRTGVVTKRIAEHGAYINQHLTCIRLNLKKANPIYVAYYMESDAGKEQFASKNQSAVKAGLNFNAINSLKLVVPPLSLQNDFAAFVERVDQQKQAVQQSLEKLELMKKALMQEYFG
jgi:type I restriction enzyme S subunit